LKKFKPNVLPPAPTTKSKENLKDKFLKLDFKCLTVWSDLIFWEHI